MPERDPAHWLYRLSPDEWIAAAHGELRHAEDALKRKQQRPGVAQARRAAGMALNALLAARGDETSWGRSYVDHLHAMRADATLPEPVREAADRLLAAPLVAQVVTLGAGDTTLATLAAQIIEWARGRLAEEAGR